MSYEDLKNIGNKVFTIVYGVSGKEWISRTKFSKWGRIVTDWINYASKYDKSFIKFWNHWGVHFIIWGWLNSDYK